MRSLGTGEVELVATEGCRLEDRGCQRPRQQPIGFISDARAVDDLADVVLEQLELRDCICRRLLPFSGEGQVQEAGQVVVVSGEQIGSVPAKRPELAAELMHRVHESQEEEEAPVLVCWFRHRSHQLRCSRVEDLCTVEPQAWLLL